MNKVSFLVRRELSAFFVSPIAYLVLTVFLLLAGLDFSYRYFSSESEQFAYDAVSALLRDMSVLLLFLVPLLTMRSLSDEVNSGTIETLMTAPITNTAVVVSKFLAAFAFVVVMILSTLAFPVVLRLVAGDAKPDPGPMISGYFGLMLFGMTVVSIGICVSACVRNQISAAVAAGLVLALLWWAGTATAAQAGHWTTRAIQYLGILQHYDSFAKGLIDTRDVIFYVTATGLSLFGGVAVVAVRRWR